MATLICLTNGYKTVRETKRELFEKINESETNFIIVREEKTELSGEGFETNIILEEISINLAHLIYF